MLHPARRFFLRPKAVHMRADHVAVPRQGDGRLQKISEGTGAETRQRRVQCAERFRRGDRLIADFVDAPLQDEAEAVFGLFFQKVLPHGVGDGAGGAGVKVEAQMLADGRQVQVHAAKPGDAAHERVDHRLRQGRRDGGVHGVAARP